MKLDLFESKNKSNYLSDMWQSRLEILRNVLLHLTTFSAVPQLTMCRLIVQLYGRFKIAHEMLILRVLSEKYFSDKLILGVE